MTTGVLVSRIDGMVAALGLMNARTTSSAAYLPPVFVTFTVYVAESVGALNSVREGGGVGCQSSVKEVSAKRRRQVSRQLSGQSSRASPRPRVAQVSTQPPNGAAWGCGLGGDDAHMRCRVQRGR